MGAAVEIPSEPVARLAWLNAQGTLHGILLPDGKGGLANPDVLHVRKPGRRKAARRAEERARAVLQLACVQEGQRVQPPAVKASAELLDLDPKPWVAKTLANFAEVETYQRGAGLLPADWDEA